MISTFIAFPRLLWRQPMICNHEICDEKWYGSLVHAFCVPPKTHREPAQANGVAPDLLICTCRCFRYLCDKKTETTKFFLHVYTVIENVWKRKIGRSEKRFKVWKSLSFSDIQCNYQTMKPTLSDLWVWYHPMPYVWKNLLWPHESCFRSMLFTSPYDTIRAILHDATFIYSSQLLPD